MLNKIADTLGENVHSGNALTGVAEFGEELQTKTTKLKFFHYFKVGVRIPVFIACAVVIRTIKNNRIQIRSCSLNNYIFKLFGFQASCKVVIHIYDPFTGTFT